MHCGGLFLDPAKKEAASQWSTMQLPTELAGQAHAAADLADEGGGSAGDERSPSSCISVSSCMD